MASVARALSRIKSDLGPYLTEASVEDACREAGHRWRERKLGPVATLHLFVLQVLHFHTAIRHLRHLAKKPVNAAAYCKGSARGTRTLLPTPIQYVGLKAALAAGLGATRRGGTRRAGPGMPASSGASRPLAEGATGRADRRSSPAAWRRQT